ncbi:hypothetical protein [Methanoregula sp.]|uniref:hypothetical protein n=1 Tax=Methanoregula sp. TaxID=2052170 RepID=UPI003BB0F3D5
MKSDPLDLYLHHLEWECLQEDFEFTGSISKDHLPIIPTKVSIRRDENYGITVNIFGKKDPKLDLQEFLKSQNNSNKLFAEPFEVKGEEGPGVIKYVLPDCYLGSGESHYENGEEIFNFKLISFRFERTIISDKEPSQLTEWYINSSDPTFVFPRSTHRRKDTKFIYVRDIDGKLEEKVSGPRNEQISTFDFAFIECEKYGFIIHQVPKVFGPTWSEHSLGIEYRKEYGYIPEPKERESISEIVSFILGKHLLNCGHTIFDEDRYLIKQVAINPWGIDIRGQCKSPSIPPISLHFDSNATQIEKILPPLILKYLELKDTLKFNEVLWRYWIAEQMPLGTNIPIYANGIEILINNWFKMHESKPKSVYISKKEFDDRMVEILPLIEKRFSDVDTRVKIIQKINKSFNMSGNEKFEEFLSEIGINIGIMETAAIAARNKMIHNSIEETPQKIRDMVILSQTYRVFFNRVILKILGYSGNYIDYSVAGYPLKPILSIAGNL